MRPVRLLALLLALAAAPARVQETVRTAEGVFEYQGSATGVVIAAPHGAYDVNTAPIAAAAAAHLRAGYVIFRATAPGLRINVNRPTEGAGRACASEPLTGRARATYEMFLRLVRATAGVERLPLYAEIHGNAEPRASHSIQVATKGIHGGDARAVKDAYPALLAVIRARAPSFPALDFRIEPVDQILFTGSCAKRLGILATEMIPRAMHLELPRAARDEPLLDAAAALVSGLLGALPGAR